MTRNMIFQQMSAGEVHGHVCRRTIAAGQTAVQSYEIVELEDSGRALLLDGCIQSTEYDEVLYHEALVFPAFAHAGEVRKVLCLGGASGGLLKQVLKFPLLTQVLLLDIDPEMHQASRTHLAHMHGDTLKDPRLHIAFGDPADMVADLSRQPDQQGKFDVVIADLPDATGGSYAARLFTCEFYEALRSILAPAGVYVTQAGQAHFRHCRFLNRVLGTLSTCFAHVVPYTLAVPSLGIPWAFVLASDSVHLRGVTAEQVAWRIDTLPPGSLAAYDAETHTHMFHLPKSLRMALAQPEPLITATDMAHVSVAHNESRG